MVLGLHSLRISHLTVPEGWTRFELSTDISSAEFPIPRIQIQNAIDLVLVLLGSFHRSIRDVLLSFSFWGVG